MKELQAIIDNMENLVQTAKKKPFSEDIVVNRDEMLSLINQLKTTMPDVIKDAQYVVQNRNKILDEAEAQGVKYVEDAKKEANDLVLDSVIMQEAEAQAEQLVSEAKEYKNQVAYDVKMQIDKIMSDSEMTLSDSINLIRNNREELRGSLLKYDNKR